MTITVDFLPFASGSGANVESQSAYVADTTVLNNGFTTGIASAVKLNKVWRQSSLISAAVANYIGTTLNTNVVDDGTITALIANLGQATRLTGYAVDTSSIVNVMTANLPVAPASFIDGEVITIKPAISNTGAVSLNLNGLGAIAVYTSSGALSGGELTAGFYYNLAWSSALSKWVLMNSATSAITQSTPDNSTKIATTAFVKNQAYATLTSPSFAGVPTAPTPATSDSSATLATTAFVHNNTAALIPSGTRMLFAQAGAPTGWTQDVSDTANNRMMRVVAGAGNGVGGSADPSYMNVVPAHTNGVVTGGETANHKHDDLGHTHSNNGYLWFIGGGGTQFVGGSGLQLGGVSFGTGYANLGTESVCHSHYGSTDNGSSSTNWYPRYINIIICNKN